MADRDSKDAAAGDAYGDSSLPNPYAGLPQQPPHIEGFQVWRAPAQEGFGEKFKRKTMENPFVPIGCGLTAAALIYGISTFSSGNRRRSQTMMRARVLFQGLTLAAILVGVAVNGMKSKK
ncbi:HIG1 domain family member 2A, mitochondrial-like [Branchiostoma lanceolatum]|uniref:HIG1 domain family member 2A, mitochondrial-like n=1 Tax=Branchiostoma lanceolatum TaxID=7740 RepID=UPI00345193D8